MGNKIRTSWFLILMIFFLGIEPFTALASPGNLKSQLLKYAGESFTTLQDPSYQSYDLALRQYVADRIHQRFGIVLDPKNYSGFDLLEIEALFKCKKKEEGFEHFLKTFPKHP